MSDDGRLPEVTEGGLILIVGPLDLVEKAQVLGD